MAMVEDGAIRTKQSPSHRAAEIIGLYNGAALFGRITGTTRDSSHLSRHSALHHGMLDRADGMFRAFLIDAKASPKTFTDDNIRAALRHITDPETQQRAQAICTEVFG